MSRMGRHVLRRNGGWRREVGQGVLRARHTRADRARAAPCAPHAESPEPRAGAWVCVCVCGSDARDVSIRCACGGCCAAVPKRRVHPPHVAAPGVQNRPPSATNTAPRKVANVGNCPRLFPGTITPPLLRLGNVDFAGHARGNHLLRHAGRHSQAGADGTDYCQGLHSMPCPTPSRAAGVRPWACTGGGWCTEFRHNTAKTRVMSRN